MITPLNILDAREERSHYQEKLIQMFHLPLLVIRANYPGLYKNNKITNYIVETIFDAISFETFPLHIEKIDSFEGIIYLLSIDLIPIELKKISIHIETTHPLGRLVDIDIIDLNNYTLSRSDLGKPPRSCFICDDIAHNCVRSRKHSLKKVLKYIETKVKFYKKGD